MTDTLQLQFDDAIDNATNAVITEFEFLGLPENDQLSDLMVQLNDAIADVMNEWK